MSEPSYTSMGDAALLRCAVEAWRAAPARSKLAEQIVRLGEIVQVDPIAMTEGSFEASWIARCNRHDVADLHLLLGTIDAKKYNTPMVRLRALRAFPRDPRIPAGALAALRAWRDRVMVDVFRVLEAYRDDPATARAIASLKDKHAGRSKPLGRKVADYLKELKWAPPRVENANDALSEALSARLTPEARAARRERALSVPDDLAALWERAYADPDDTATLSVLADRLIERSDPRGEFMALQLKRAGSGRPAAAERALLKQWEQTWFGDAAWAFAASGHVWRNGLLVEATIKGTLADKPITRALEAVNLRGCIAPPPAADAPRLRRMTGLQLWAGTQEYRHEGVVDLEIHEHYWSRIIEYAAAANHFPALRRLSLRRADPSFRLSGDPYNVRRAFDRFWGTPLCESLEQLELVRTTETLPGEIPGWFDRLRSRPSLKTLALVPYHAVDGLKTKGWLLELSGASLRLVNATRAPDYGEARRYVGAAISAEVRQIHIAVNKPPPDPPDFGASEVAEVRWEALR